MLSKFLDTPIQCFALALGAGAKSRMGMGVVIVGGILFSLILTLFVIPAIYTYLSKEHKEHA